MGNLEQISPKFGEQMVSEQNGSKTIREDEFQVAENFGMQLLLYSSP